MVGLLTLIVFWQLIGRVVGHLVRHMTRLAEATALDNITGPCMLCLQAGETMRKILELAKRAPSCFNVQPYKIVIVESDEGKEKLAQAMHGPNPGHIRSSSFAAVFAADPDPIPLLGQDPPDFVVQAIEQVSLAQQSTPEAWAVKNVMLVVGHFLLEMGGEKRWRRRVIVPTKSLQVNLVRIWRSKATAATMGTGAGSG